MKKEYERLLATYSLFEHIVMHYSVYILNIVWTNVCNIIGKLILGQRRQNSLCDVTSWVGGARVGAKCS